MAEMAQKIIKVDKTELLDLLNIAFVEEWLAYYQYWLGARLIVGPMRNAIADEFNEHAGEELKHAEMIAQRIIELGGTPILNPNRWQEVALCKYDEPEKPYVMNLLEQNLTAERCAIVRYQKICEMTFGKDYETYRIAAKILHEEIEHEEEINTYKEDIIQACKYKDQLQP